MSDHGFSPIGGGGYGNPRYLFIIFFNETKWNKQNTNFSSIYILYSIHQSIMIDKYKANTKTNIIHHQHHHLISHSNNLSLSLTSLYFFFLAIQIYSTFTSSPKYRRRHIFAIWTHNITIFFYTNLGLQIKVNHLYDYQMRI